MSITNPPGLVLTTAAAPKQTAGIASQALAAVLSGKTWWTSTPVRWFCGSVALRLAGGTGAGSSGNHGSSRAVALLYLPSLT
ncbi:MAG: hypothetical protein ACPIOQ_82165 [Promethearchaeia archaeon]